METLKCLKNVAMAFDCLAKIVYLVALFKVACGNTQLSFGKYERKLNAHIYFISKLVCY